MEKSIASRMTKCGWLDQYWLTDEGEAGMARLSTVIRRNNLTSPEVSLVQFTRECNYCSKRRTGRLKSPACKGWIRDLKRLQIQIEDEAELREVVTIAEFSAALSRKELKAH